MILRQVSPEANDIFDLIMALYHKCDGDWDSLAAEAQVNLNETHKFLNYAAMFLSNIGNYFVSHMCAFFSFLFSSSYLSITLIGLWRPEDFAGNISRKPQEAGFNLRQYQHHIEPYQGAYVCKDSQQLGLSRPFHANCLLSRRRIFEVSRRPQCCIKRHGE